MSRPALEVADIFRDRGPAWRRANAGHVSLEQLKVMSAIENCRTAALGGHVARCEDCAHTTIAYNSCRNRHCPKCQGAAARQWVAARAAALLPIPYFHVVFTLPSAIGDITYQNKAVLDYLSRYTHRVAISNRRLIAVDQRSVTFKVKDYRIEGPGRYTTMTLDIGEFIRRFLIHVLPRGFHRIRHYGLFASANRAETIARARELLGLATPAAEAAAEIDPAAAQPLAEPCPCCRGRMLVIEP